MTTSDIAIWFANKYRARMREVGLQAVCTQLRKQGVPPDVAAHLLYGRPTRRPDASACGYQFEGLVAPQWRGNRGLQ